MSDRSAIEWTDSTFNPWLGCTKVGPGCDGCYAEAWGKRFGVEWGTGKPRRRTSASNWRKPLAWNNMAPIVNGHRRRVFCASLADVFDNEVPGHWRADLFALIRATPNLDWLIVTKRIGNAAKMLPDDWSDGYSNVVLLATVCNQDEADRDVPKLLATPARRRGLSIEPMLGPIDLRHIAQTPSGYLNALSSIIGPNLDWVICGGESGPGARLMDISWVYSIVQQCKASGVACFVKQMGAHPISTGAAGAGPDGIYRYRLKDKKGGDWSEWLPELRVREFPDAA